MEEYIKYYSEKLANLFTQDMGRTHELTKEMKRLCESEGFDTEEFFGRVRVRAATTMKVRRALYKR